MYLESEARVTSQMDMRMMVGANRNNNQMSLYRILTFLKMPLEKVCNLAVRVKDSPSPISTNLIFKARNQHMVTSACYSSHSNQHILILIKTGLHRPTFVHLEMGKGKEKEKGHFRNMHIQDPGTGCTNQVK